MPGNLQGNGDLQQRLGEPADVPELPLAGPRVEQPERRLLLPVNDCPAETGRKGIDMTQKLTFCAMLLGGVCLLPLGALGADLRHDHRGGVPRSRRRNWRHDNEVDLRRAVGCGGTNTGQYGRYNGFTEQGVDGLFGFSSITRDPWNSPARCYCNFYGYEYQFQFGDNLGTAQYPTAFAGNVRSRASRTANIRTRRTTHWAERLAGLRKSAIRDNGRSTAWLQRDLLHRQHHRLDLYGERRQRRAQQRLRALGRRNQPPASGGGDADHGAFAYPKVAADAGARSDPFQDGTRRDIVGLERHVPLERLDHRRRSSSHEHKEGTVEESVDGGYGGQAFTLPVDYDTDRLRC